MPVFLKPEVWPEWLGEKPAAAPQLKGLAPYPSEEMVAWPVSPRVGNVKNNDPSLIEPIARCGVGAGPDDDSRTKLDGLAFRAEGHVSYLTITASHCN